MDLTAVFGKGWTGIIGANGTGKTTLLRLVCGELTPEAGALHVPGRAVLCVQRTDSPPAGLDAFLGATDSESCRLRGELAVEGDWLARWGTLSHGERKRAQIGVTLWSQPAVLAVDEPTNHIDAPTRALLGNALRAFDGIGLLVSHDRALLDTLCHQCLFLDPPDTVMRPGGYTEGHRQAQIEKQHSHRVRIEARRALRRLEREAERRRQEVAGAARRLSKRGLDPRDHDARAKINGARLSGKDGQAGRLARQMDERAARARDALEASPVQKEYRLGIWIPSAHSPRDVVLRLPASRLVLGGQRVLDTPQLVLGPTDRVAVTGPNGVGKSTLIRHLLPRMNVPTERITYLQQELDASVSRQLHSELMSLPEETRGQVLTVVSRLGSRPQRLLESQEPTPGETRKLLLALGIARSPHVIVMDEPTNHLDLPAIECLEAALSDCPCALLLVSHDMHFLRRLCRIEWRMDWRDTTHAQLHIGHLSSLS